jgi:periplasmic protein TonB
LNKQLLRFAAASALSLMGVASHAGNGAKLATPLATACAQPEWSREALRYELEGTTTVTFDLDDAGKPQNARIARSSGWQVLDNMSTSALAGCRFDPPDNPKVKRSDIKMQYKWTLDLNSEKGSPASLVPDSCPATERFAGFRPMQGDVSGTEGVLVRFLISPAGQPFGIQFEPDVPLEAVRDGLAFIAACRFTPAQDKNGPAPGNLFGRLLPKPV